MNNLTTRKIVLGILMTLVLALGVQGIANSVTLTATSKKVQSKRSGLKFEISFTTGPNNPDAVENNAGHRVTQTSLGGTEVRIDSDGYKIKVLKGNEYRLLSVNASTVKGYDTSYNSIAFENADDTYTAYTNSIVARSGDIYTDPGAEALYHYGTTADSAKVGPQVEINSDDDYDDKQEDSERFWYNQEAIRVISAKTVTTGPPPKMDIELKSNGFPSASSRVQYWMLRCLKRM